MSNFDNKDVSRYIDQAPVYDHSIDRASQYLAEILRQLQGAGEVLARLGTDANQIIANLSKDPAAVIGTVNSAITITEDSNDDFRVEFQDDGTDIDIVISAGAHTMATVAAELNADASFAAKGIARVTYDGYLWLSTLEPGITSQIEIKANGNSCNTVLGLTAAATEGDALQWHTARATAVTEVTSAIAAALTLVRLAGQDLGNTPWDDVAPSG
jgi:hypothetical protein